MRIVTLCTLCMLSGLTACSEKPNREEALVQACIAQGEAALRDDDFFPREGTAFIDGDVVFIEAALFVRPNVTVQGNLACLSNPNGEISEASWNGLTFEQGDRRVAGTMDQWHRQTPARLASHLTGQGLDQDRGGAVVLAR